jgi:hypothetical protein
MAPHCSARALTQIIQPIVVVREILPSMSGIEPTLAPDALHVDEEQRGFPRHVRRVSAGRVSSHGGSGCRSRIS